jgi:oxygen-independent coproporphyrinogen-3 oxidase
MMMQHVPRYTSYPTAPHFHDKIGQTQYISWLKALPADDALSLYFHIPYCKQLCWFCGCHTKIVNHYEPIARYVKMLEQEVQLLAPIIRHHRVTHIHFGGGSPTALSAEDFSRFMALLRREFSFTDGMEIAIEMDPRTLDSDKISAYSQAGITRASLGVQCFDAKVQKAINRIQPYEMVADKLAQLRKNNINALNIDLIYGLPYQTPATMRDTIARTLSLNPDRISLFGYAHVPWMKKHQKLVPENALPEKQARIEMANLAREALLKAGFSAVGIDHFARKEDALAKAAKSQHSQRNFQGYTTDNAAALLGFGVSAISSLPQAYVQNTSSNIDYATSIKAQKLPIIRGIALSDDDVQRRDIIMSLMCHLQVKICNKKYAKAFENLQPYFETGDVSYVNGVLRVDAHARNHLRVIASAFDAYLPHTTHRYSQAI